MARLEVTLPAWGSVEAIQHAGDLPPFGALQLGFATALSRQLTTNPAVRLYPELVALGFWLRAANVRRLADRFTTTHKGETHLPRGIVFHVAPSNVDTIFVYSWVLSLLCGNRNLIRISSRQSPQTAVLLDLLRGLFEEPAWHAIAARTLVVRYEHDAGISKRLSALCDMRVLWGGDATIAALRAFAIAPHATELAFANKFSLCVLDARAVPAASPSTLADLARGFYTDAYWFGQMACSSPRLVLWVGSPNQLEPARSVFWSAVARELDSRGEQVGAADAMNKEVAVDALAIEVGDVHIDAFDPRMTRVALGHATVRDDLHCGAGLFHEARIDTLDELQPHLTRKIQTVTHFGLETTAWHEFLTTRLPAGIDRVVPIGQALDFETVWDGLDLPSAFLRQVIIR